MQEAMDLLSNNHLLKWTDIKDKPQSNMEYLQVLANHVSSSFSKWDVDETKKWFYDCLRKYEDGEEMVQFFEEKEWLDLNEVISLVAIWLEPPRRLIEVSECLGGGKKCVTFKECVGNMPKDPEFYECIPLVAHESLQV